MQSSPMSGGVAQQLCDHLQEQAIRAESPPQTPSQTHSPIERHLKHPTRTSDDAEASGRRWDPKLDTIQEMLGDERHHEEHVITHRERAHERDTIMREIQSPTAHGRDSIPYSTSDREWGAHERDTISYKGGEPERTHERNPIPCNSGDGRLSRTRRRRPTDAFRIYFANATSWHEGAQAYLGQEQAAMGSSHIVCLAETHLQGPKLIKAVKTVGKMGWAASMQPAVPTPGATRSGPGHGGVGALVKKNLHSHPITPDLKRAIQQPEHRDPQTQWAGVRVRLEVMDLLVVTIYLAPG